MDSAAASQFGLFFYYEPHVKAVDGSREEQCVTNSSQYTDTLILASFNMMDITLVRTPGAQDMVTLLRLTRPEWLPDQSQLIQWDTGLFLKLGVL